ncbi:MAG: serine O-acetyltransferase EpsC [bacterium]|nr:serine O-acetyltransferase EpsC [bacterium]
MIRSLAETLHKKHSRFLQLKHPCAGRQPAPSSELLDEIIEGFWDILFPLRFHQKDLGTSDLPFITKKLKKTIPNLKKQIHRGLCFTCHEKSCRKCAQQAGILTEKFLKTLPAIQERLASDVQAHYEGDPASTCTEETILCYPGILAITCHRIAHELYKLKVPLIPRMMTELAHAKTGIDIHPGARIGKSFFIDHGTGVVIGETTIIGNNVRIYQGVTLGAKSFPLDENGKPIKGIDRHPIVEDDVIIYSEATLLGRIRIGKGSIIGGNVWLVHDVPPGSRIVQSTKKGTSL